jgi:hypothetical protein
MEIDSLLGVKRCLCFIVDQLLSLSRLITVLFPVSSTNHQSSFVIRQSFTEKLRTDTFIVDNFNQKDRNRSIAVQATALLIVQACHGLGHRR